MCEEVIGVCLAEAIVGCGIQIYKFWKRIKKKDSNPGTDNSANEAGNDEDDETRTEASMSVTEQDSSHVPTETMER
eukprot:CAMPEP_0185729198 /NCGR_PEP_ID=MMETSP1171-20130828/4553_1 /TAXON_ID=374046 /ORGANISM="Helicotheca tamensis, Strain CCMP826" /LENGTH=75 /DNA_ID=CAMNT_0028397981 /DNA_START=145 /DNA_END=372 /DNA_ORIENTATION=-